MDRSDRPLLRAVTLLEGFMTLAVGILFITTPTIVKIGNEWMLAALLIGGGIMSAGFAITTLRMDVRLYTSLLAVLSLATGLTALLNPLDRMITLTTLLGFYFMIESGLMGGLGLSVRPNWSVSALVFVIAIISFVMSLLIWVRLAGAPQPVIVSMLGISFVARGAMYMALSWMMKGRPRLLPTDVERPKTLEPSGI